MHLIGISFTSSRTKARQRTLARQIKSDLNPDPHLNPYPNG